MVKSLMRRQLGERAKCLVNMAWSVGCLHNFVDLLAKIETEGLQFLTQLITQLRHEFFVHVVAP